MFRTRRLQPYPCQIVGSLALTKGLLGDMSTGEGKTLTLALAIAFDAKKNQPCHIVTANDYLAKRDAENLMGFYTECGLQVGYIQATMPHEDRKKQYQADVVYATSKELIADFLRDRLVLGNRYSANKRLLERILNKKSAQPENTVQRGFCTVMVDEADHVLIDEAVTPLILSQPDDNEKMQETYTSIWLFSSSFIRDEDYLPNPKIKEINFTKKGLDKFTESSSVQQNLSNSQWQKSLVIQALKCLEFFIKGKDYIVQNEKIVIIDQSTGRIALNRSWGQGIHQFIELKEGLKPTPQSITLSSISFQHFFRLIPKLSGITGTAWESRHEFWNIYELAVVKIKKNKPSQKIIHTPLIQFTKKDKWLAVLKDIKKQQNLGRPVLIGTSSVNDSLELSNLLKQEQVPFKLINAIEHENETEIIYKAGHENSVVIATNMAGRGTDIVISDKISDRGGLHIIATQFNPSARIDQQLYGRCARQGQKGSVSCIVSLEDDLLKSFPKILKHILRFSLGKVPFSALLLKFIFSRAQKYSSKLGRKSRLQILKQDKWTEESLPFKSL